MSLRPEPGRNPASSDAAARAAGAEYRSTQAATPHGSKLGSVVVERTALVGGGGATPPFFLDDDAKTPAAPIAALDDAALAAPASEKTRPSVRSVRETPSGVDSLSCQGRGGQRRFCDRFGSLGSTTMAVRRLELPLGLSLLTPGAKEGFMGQSPAQLGTHNASDLGV